MHPLYSPVFCSGVRWTRIWRFWGWRCFMTPPRSLLALPKDPWQRVTPTRKVSKGVPIWASNKLSNRMASLQIQIKFFNYVVTDVWNSFNMWSGMKRFFNKMTLVQKLDSSFMRVKTLFTFRPGTQELQELQTYSVLSFMLKNDEICYTIMCVIWLTLLIGLLFTHANYLGLDSDHTNV